MSEENTEFSNPTETENHTSGSEINELVTDETSEEEVEFDSGSGAEENKNEYVAESDEPQINSVNEKKETRKKPLFRAPIIIAACIFLCTLIGFGVWKCFFDTTLEGDWKVDLKSIDGEKTYSYVFTFDNEKHFEMSGGGVTLKGNYYLDSHKNSDGSISPIFSVYLTNLGSSYISADFGYGFEGNVFTGRTLKLTDYTGLFFPPDNDSSDAETVKKKKSCAESVVIDGNTYYIFSFDKTDFNSKTEPYDDFKKNDALLGSWIFTEESSGVAYTFTFYDDGTFEQLSKESSLVGAYKLEDGTCTLGYYNMSNEKVEAPVSYAVKGDELTFNGLEYKKTADKNDYKKATK